MPGTASQAPLRVGRLTLSDRAFNGTYSDLSGPEIERTFAVAWGGDCDFVRRILPDERPAIEATLRSLCDEEKCRIVITTGGTGPAPRDVTPEATLAVLDRELPGFGETMRSVSFASVPTAILSRATAGIRGRSIIVNLPGNPRAIAVCLSPLMPALRECLQHLNEAFP